MKRLLDRLFRPSRTHYRSSGPVTINPDVRETVHVRGTQPKEPAMTTQRDELAREIFIADNNGQSREASLQDWAAYVAGSGTDTYAHNIADGLLAAGWTRPREISTAHEDNGAELLAIRSDGTVRGTIENAGHAAKLFITELRGMTEAIAAQAKVDALREAAYVYGAGEWVDGFMSVRDDVTAVQAIVAWLRARAADIEGATP